MTPNIKIMVVFLGKESLVKIYIYIYRLIRLDLNSRCAFGRSIVALFWPIVTQHNHTKTHGIRIWWSEGQVAIQFQDGCCANVTIISASSNFLRAWKATSFQAISALKLLAIGSSNKRLHKFSMLDTQHGGVAKMLALLKNEQATELPMHPRLCGAPRVCKLWNQLKDQVCCSRFQQCSVKLLPKKKGVTGAPTQQSNIET